MFEKTHMRSIPFKQFQCSSDWKWPPLVILIRKSFGWNSFYASLLQTIDGVMSLALCPQVVSQASQHFRSSQKQATCEGCFARRLSARSFPSALIYTNKVQTVAARCTLAHYVRFWVQMKITGLPTTTFAYNLLSYACSIRHVIIILCIIMRIYTTNGPFSWLFPQKLSNTIRWVRLFCMALVERWEVVAGRWYV